MKYGAFFFVQSLVVVCCQMLSNVVKSLQSVVYNKRALYFYGAKFFLSNQNKKIIFTMKYEKWTFWLIVIIGAALIAYAIYDFVTDKQVDEKGTIKRVAKKKADAKKAADVAAKK